MNQEKKVKNSVEPVSISSTETILNQMKYYICKIKINAIYGTGFFCKIPFGNNITKNFFMTNYHVLNEKYYNENNKINLLINDEDITKIIDLRMNRITYFNENYDITLIELNENDNINNFLELDDKLFRDNHEIIYENKSLYILQYPQGKNAAVSYGLLTSIDKFEIKHKCSTENGSSGSPILNLETNKVIGIHKEGSINFDFNKGTFLKYPLIDFIKKYEKIFGNQDNNILNNPNVNNIQNEKNNHFNQINNYDGKISKNLIENNIYKKDMHAYNKIPLSFNYIKNEENSNNKIHNIMLDNDINIRNNICPLCEYDDEYCCPNSYGNNLGKMYNSKYRECRINKYNILNLSKYKKKFKYTGKSLQNFKNKDINNNNYEQNQFNDFLRKLMKIESKIEDAKITLSYNQDFNCEDAFRLFESNEKGYLDKNDIENGLNSIGINPSRRELDTLMKRFDLEKNNYITYPDFFDMVVPFEKSPRLKVKNRKPKSPDNFSEKTINDLKNVFELIIKFENDINNDRKNFGTLRLQLKVIFALIDKTGKGFFHIDELMVYLVDNNLAENNKGDDLLFIRLDKNRTGKVDFTLIDDELQIIY